MNEHAYWRKYLARRTTRRRLIAGTTATALGLGVISCMGPEQHATASPVLTSTPTDTTDAAKAGGVFKSFMVSDAPSFDPLSSNSPATLSQIAGYTYPRLFKYTTPRFPASATGAVEGDLAESYELSADRLTLTLRLRQGMKWESRAPTNGRAIDAQDVIFSWTKFARVAPYRYELAYHVDHGPGGPVESVSSPDARTVIFKLKQPNSSILPLLAFKRLLYIMPRESEGGFDPRTDIRGYGPWLISENRPGLRSWTKNPDYYVKGRPFPGKIEQVHAPDYASRTAHFRAGLIWSSVVSQEDVLSTKRELPQLLLRQADSYGTAQSSLAFGYDGDSPWKDERLRQAASMLIDRETLVNLKTNRERLEAAGLPVGVRYHTAIGAGWEGYWVDPRDEASFGPTAQYFRFEQVEARRLIIAAGFPDGIDTLLHYAASSEGSAYTRTTELVSGMLHEGGIRARLDPHEFQNDWVPNYFFGYNGIANVGKQMKGFPGLIYRTSLSYPNFASQAFATLHRSGTRFIGMTPDGKNAGAGDPEVNRRVEEIRREFDTARQKTLALDFARIMARKSYDIPMPPHASLGFSLSWPVIGNLGVYRGWPAGSAATESNLHLWIDSSKPPINSTPS